MNPWPELAALGALVFAAGFLMGATAIGLLAWRLARHRREHLQRAHHRYLEIL